MLEIDMLSQARINNALKKIEESQAVKRIAFSSYTHASFDQETRIAIGDIRWQVFVSQAEKLGCEFAPLSWEMQPPGVLNEIAFLAPNKDQILKTKVRSGFSTMCWWAAIDQELFERLQTTLLEKGRWASVVDFVRKQLGGYPGEVIDKVSSRIEDTKRLYEQVMTESAGVRLSELSERLYTSLAKQVFGDLAEQFLVARQSYFGSELGNKVNQRAIEGLKDGWLAKVIETLRLYNRGIFVGGNWGAPWMVTFDPSIGSYMRNNIDSKSGKVNPYGVKIAEAAIIEMLEGPNMRVSGALFDPLVLFGENELIIHDGNDYGNPRRSKVLLSQAKAEYVKLFPDDQDSFSPILFVTQSWGMQEVVPSMVSLFIWDLEPDFWAEKLKEAAKSGKPRKIDVFREITNAS